VVEKAIQGIYQEAAIRGKISYVVVDSADIGNIAASFTGYAQLKAKTLHFLQ
jgi:hypothetical protein